MILNEFSKKIPAISNAALAFIKVRGEQTN